MLTLEGVLRRAALPAGNGGGASWWALQGGSRQELRCEEETAGGRSQGGEAAAQMQYEERGRAGGDRGWKGKSVAFPEKRGWSRVSKRHGEGDFSAMALQISRLIIEVFGGIICLFFA